MPQPYETALRHCLRDFHAMADNAVTRHQGIRHEHAGQWHTLIRDAELLLNREDCPTYDYKKETR